MNPEKAEQIVKIIADFPSLEGVTINTLQEYYDRNGIKVEDRPTLDDLKDYRVQVDADEKTVRLYARIIAEMGKLQHTPLFTTTKKQGEIFESNNEISKSIVMFCEEEAIPIHLISIIKRDLTSLLTRTIEQAETIASNKTIDVFRHLAFTHFGEEANMGNIANYAVEVFTKAEADNKAKNETA